MIQLAPRQQVPDEVPDEVSRNLFPHEAGFAQQRDDQDAELCPSYPPLSLYPIRQPILEIDRFDHTLLAQQFD
jgi:hypothetical protein